MSLEKRMARRSTIFAVARSLVASEGYEGTTMLEIARQAKVAPATLYNTFGTKDNLLREAVEDLFQAQVMLARHDPSAVGLDRLFAYQDRVFDLYESNPGYARKLLLAFTRSDPARPLASSLSRAQNATVELSIEEMHAGGQLADWAPPQRVSRILEGILHASAQRWAFTGASVRALRSEVAFGTCALLLGVCTGRARPEIEARMDEVTLSRTASAASG